MVSALLLWWVFRGEDLGAILRQLRAANPYLLIASGAIATTGGVIRAIRWRLLLAPLGIPTSLNARWKALNIGFMVTNLFPARPGEIVRPFALSRMTPVSMSAALGTVVLERVLDTVALLGLLLLTLLSPAFPRGATVLGRPLAYAVWGAIGIVVAGLIVIAILLLWPRVAIRVVRIVASVLPGNLEERLVGALEAFLSGLELIRRPASLVLPLLWSMALWIWMAAAFWVAFQAFGIHAGATAAMFTQCVVGVFVAVPAAPGFVGTLQAGVSIALREVFGVGSRQALSLAVGYHLAGFIPVTALGLYYAWTLGLHLSSLGADAKTARERGEGREGPAQPARDPVPRRRGMAVPAPDPVPRRRGWLCPRRTPYRDGGGPRPGPMADREG